MTYLQDMQQLCRGMATMTRMLLAPTTAGCPLMSHPRTLLTVGQAEFDPRNLHANIINAYRVGFINKMHPCHGLTSKLLEVLCY
jgi:hypothetical protein